MRIIFEQSAFEGFNSWAKTDKKVHKRIISLIKDVQREPFSGLGKPEPLKYELSGYWSRRITQSDRLVYKVTSEDLIIISCKYHY